MFLFFYFCLTHYLVLLSYKYIDSYAKLESDSLYAHAYIGNKADSDCLHQLPYLCHSFILSLDKHMFKLQLNWCMEAIERKAGNTKRSGDERALLYCLGL